jgi:asparagine N-glycosylation enzyme membrane subunit Stt3
MPQTQTRKARHRTYARNRPRRRVGRNMTEADSTYFLKLVIIVLLSTLWLKFAAPMTWNGIPLGGFPLGALIALVAIKLFEKDTYDRKIWFAVMIIVVILSYFVPAGVVI